MREGGGQSGEPIGRFANATETSCTVGRRSIANANAASASAAARAAITTIADACGRMANGANANAASANAASANATERAAVAVAGSSFAAIPIGAGFGHRGTVTAERGANATARVATAVAAREMIDGARSRPSPAHSFIGERSAA